jgi:hypothetical protein
MRFLEFCESVLGVTFEAGQRIFWGVAADGIEPCELSGADADIAREIFGDITEPLPAVARRHIAVVKGADVGFSYIGGLRLLYRALTAERGDAAKGEIRPALCVAPDIRTGRIPVRNALGAADKVPSIKALIESRTSDGFVLRREDGWYTSVETLPASVGGRALRGRRYVEVLFDEGAFFRDQGYSVNDVDCRRAAEPRCLGTFWNGSTPWLESSDLWRTYTRNFGSPTDALAARLPTLIVRSDPRVVATVQSARERDPEGAATEFDCIPPAGSGGYYFDGFAIGEAESDHMPIELPRELEWVVAAGFDPAFQRDTCAGAVVRMKNDRIELCELFERRPEKGKPLVPSAMVREFGAVALKHGAQIFASDIHYQESVREHLPAGLRFIEAPGGNPGKAEVYGATREVIHGARFKWSAGHKKLTQQMRDVIAKPLPGGLVAITSPRRKGSHGDLASAVCLAVWNVLRGARNAPGPHNVPMTFAGGWTSNEGFL